MILSRAWLLWVLRDQLRQYRRARIWWDAHPDGDYPTPTGGDAEP